MSKPLHLIYITGLGDRNPVWQRRAVATWRWWGVRAELFQMNWADGEAWPPKLARLLARIDKLLASGQDVALVGASAGASVAINAFAARKNAIVGVVCIAGKMNRPQRIHRSRLEENPAFGPSVRACQQALQQLGPTERRRILSKYALFDEVVQRPDSHLRGARNRFTPTIEHVFTIAEQITLGAPGFIRFLKRCRKKLDNS